MLNQKISLPIDPYIDAILKKIQDFSTILIKASPGSGKTTRLPWAVASRTSKKVLVLEPRRLAAKLAAERIASEEHLNIGADVGYHFRFENKTSKESKLVFYTEGTFLKKLLHDPQLDDVGVVILDEFHERHLETDMALAYLLNIQSQRPDLKLILMSATLDTELLSRFKNSDVIEIEAPHFPVEVHYLANQPSILNQAFELKIRDALLKIPQDHDVLIFLPGMREIKKVEDYLEKRFGDIFILHSEVTKDEQEAALRPHRNRKIILSTNIAESSVTIPGVRAVIDAGIQREAHYSPWNGLKLILDTPVTKSSAIQRTGRAGRMAPGVCHRLYSLQDFEARENFTVPEIMKADLTDIYFLSRQFSSTPLWMTPPPKERWQKAENLCYLMGLIDKNERPTLLGQRLSPYPLDLRLSRVLVAGESLKREEKKKLLNFICKDLENDQTGRLYQRLSFYLEKEGHGDDWQRPLLSGFIDQVAKYRSKQNDLIHYSGKNVKLHPSLGTLSEGYYLVLDITQRQEAIKIVPIEEEWLFDHQPFPFEDEEMIVVDPSFALKSLTKLGSIVLDEKILPLDWDKLSSVQKERVTQLGQNVFEKSLESFKNTETFHRYHFWKKLNQENEISPPTLANYMDFNGAMNWDGLENFFQHIFLEIELNQKLPKAINLGGKRELKIHYPYNQDPYLEAPIQDFYGLKETPKIADNKIPLTLKLIGPHKRPLQVTKDLASFWQNTYQEMLKEFRRDYPRHHWPDDPRNAKPILLKRQLTET